MSRRPARVIEARRAGDAHQVVTVDGGGDNLYRREPCADCPWRRDAVGEFPPEAFRHSANTGSRTVFDEASLSRASHTFACHSSGAEKPAICAGYVLKGDHAVGWRIALIQGKFDPSKVRSKVKLFDSYYDMAVANGVSPDDPALKDCKPWRGKR